MASVFCEVVIDRSPDDVWDAMRDVGALHTRLVSGFVTDCRMDGDARIVTFANGVVAREQIISVDEEHRRVAWNSVGGRLSHYNSSAQVLADGSRARVVWISDLLPNEMASAIGAMMQMGTAAMKRTLETT